MRGATLHRFSYIAARCPADKLGNPGHEAIDAYPAWRAVDFREAKGGVRASHCKAFILLPIMAFAPSDEAKWPNYYG